MEFDQNIGRQIVGQLKHATNGIWYAISNHQLTGGNEWGLSNQRPSQYVHDLVADEVAVRRLLAAGFSVLSEESLFSPATGEGNPAFKDITIVVDPVDGSTNLSRGPRGLPWATSMAAVHPEFGVVAAVCSHNHDRTTRGDVFWAVKGQGAWSERLENPRDEGVIVSQLVPSDETRLSHALVAVSDPVSGAELSAMQKRSVGAGVLEMVLTANGAYDAYANFGKGHNVWDFAAAAFICKEAGMVVTELDGREIDYLDPDARHAFVIAPNADLSRELVAAVSAIRSRGLAPDWSYGQDTERTGTFHGGLRPDELGSNERDFPRLNLAGGDFRLRDGALTSQDLGVRVERPLFLTRDVRTPDGGTGRAGALPAMVRSVIPETEIPSPFILLKSPGERSRGSVGPNADPLIDRVRNDVARVRDQQHDQSTAVHPPFSRGADGELLLAIPQLSLEPGSEQEL